MSFLFPFFLAAAGAAFVPLVLHLRRRPPQERMEFSSLMFLTASPEVTTQRRRLERWFLLLLRCLALLLLALMFARPYLQQEQTTAASAGSAWVLVVDASASMQRRGLWLAARQRLHDWLGKTKREDTVSVLLFDETPRTLLPATALQGLTAAERQTLASAAMDDAAPSYRATQLDTALIQAVGQLGAGSAARRVVLLSDMQSGARVEGLRGFAWPQEVTLTVDTVEPDTAGNLSLALLPPREDSSTPGTAASTASAVRVRVTSQPDSPATQSYTLHWAGQDQALLSGQLLPGGSRVHSLPEPPATVRGVQLRGDAHDFDNTLHLAPTQPQRVSLAVVDVNHAEHDPESASFYLTRALAPSTRLRPDWQQLRSADAALPADLRWLVICGALPSGPLGQQIKAWLAAGGQALWVLTPEAEPQQAKQVLGLELQWTEATVKDYALLAELRWQEPELAPLADPTLRDFTKVHFWKHRQLSEPSLTALQGKILAKYDTGHIAWARLPLGKGQLMLMTSGWQPQDSQLAFSSRFVPLLYGFLGAAGVQWETRPQLTVGAALPVQTGLLTSPQSASKPFTTAPVADQPGIYTVQTTAGAESQSWAANLAYSETRTEALSPTVLAALGVQLHADETNPALAATEKVQLLQEEHEGRQQYWLIALGLLLWVLGTETWLAGRVTAKA